MPGRMPPTSQLDWLISTTAMIVLFWSRATRDLLKSFGWGIGHSISCLLAAIDGAISSPPAPYHLSAGASRRVNYTAQSMRQVGYPHLSASAEPNGLFGAVANHSVTRLV